MIRALMIVACLALAACGVDGAPKPPTAKGATTAAGTADADRM